MRFIATLFIVFLPINFIYGDVIYNDNVLNGCVYSGNINALFEIDVYTCGNGYFLPANYDHCVSCPNNSVCNGGTFTFNETTSQGIIYDQTITSDLEYGCDTGLSMTWAGVFEPNEHICESGYYMPANYDGCAVCPANSYCVGGTYTFNETISQGITACPTGYSSDTGASICTPNTITINWDGAESGTCTYGGTITTPVTPPTRRGYTFVGWQFTQQNE